MKRGSELPRKKWQALLAVSLTFAIGTGAVAQDSGDAKASDKQPNIIVIWGDDIDWSNISAYNLGMMVYQTPYIDRIAKDGMIFTHGYAQQSCTVIRPASKEDPFGNMWEEGTLSYWRWYADLLWTFVPAQEYIQKFMATIPDYPFQAGESLNAAGINYGTLEMKKALDQLQSLSPPRN